MKFQDACVSPCACCEKRGGKCTHSSHSACGFPTLSQRTTAAQWVPLTQAAAARGIACERTAVAAGVELTSAASRPFDASSSPNAGGGFAAVAAAVLGCCGALTAAGEQQERGSGSLAGCEAARAGAGDAPPMRREDSRSTMMPGVHREDSRSAMWPNRDRPSESNAIPGCCCPLRY